MTPTAAYVSDSGGPRASGVEARFTMMASALSALLIPLFLLRAPVIATWIAAATIVLVGMVLQRRDPVGALTVLPVALLLGPIARIELTSSVALHFGDLYLGGLVMAEYLRAGAGVRLRLGRNAVPITLAIVLALISWLFALDIVVSGVAMVALLEMLLMYLLTIGAVHHPRDVRRVMSGWLGAVVLSCILIVLAYVLGRPLLIGSGQEGTARAMEIKSSTVYLYRASFFVTGFVYPLGGAIMIVLADLFGADGSARFRLGRIAVLVTSAVAVAVLGTLTLAGALLVGFGLALYWLRYAPRGGLRTATLLVAGVALVVLLGILLRQLMPPAQFLALLGRIGQTSSFHARVVVWRNVVHFLLAHPGAAFVGVGPDATVRMGGNPVLFMLFQGPTGSREGAIDSGYLYVVLNYGVPLLLVLAWIAFRTLTVLGRSMRHQFDASAMAIWLCVAIWVPMAVTQESAVSKPIFMIVQLAALAEVFSRSEWGPSRRGHASALSSYGQTSGSTRACQRKAISSDL